MTGGRARREQTSPPRRKTPTWRRSAPRRLLGLVLVATASATVAVACGDGGGDGGEIGGSGSGTRGGPELTGEAAEGRELVSSKGCTACHTVDGGEGVGPTFAGLAGSEVTLEDGTTVTADDEYLRRAIEDPGAQVVEGYRPIMPERAIPPAEVDAIVAYLDAIGSDDSAGR